MTLKIGDKVWQREGSKWVERKIIGETRVSWIVSPAWAKTKIPKRPKQPHSEWAYSAMECFERDWVRDNVHWIGEAVSRVRDFGTLRKIAEMIEYKERKR